MRFTLRGCRVHISFYFAAIVTLMLAADKDSMAFLSFLAALIHESGHILLYLLFDDMPSRLEFGIFGIRITQKNAVSLSCRQEIAVAAAGPIMNFMVALFLCIMIIFMHSDTNSLRMAAGLNLLLGIVNFMPIEPLDGGKVLFYAIAHRKDAQYAEKAVNLCSVLFLLPLMALGFYFALFCGYNPTLLIMCIYLCVLLVKRCH